ncbi:PREDICTED: odorant receptor 22c-like [Vollenhovia emeryi]|uniref:odorant receptor 22c-like n=1 Tax=Vollenhovia emeryi TaxID=411798 RepID=UPI0005F4D680|nr:PREDICTED: odorant receptor 22c-like [Vollenhovia emeryi]
MVQYIPDLLDFVMPLNESRPRILLHQAKNFIDHQKYFHILIIHDVIGILLVGTTGIAAESFSLVNAIHAFGMFKIASYRMERMLSIDVSQISIAKSYTIFHDRLNAAVDIHRRALKFSDLLKVSMGPSYLLMMVTAICSAIVSFFRLFRIVTLHQEKMEIIKLICYVIFIFLFLVIGNFVGQEFINHDEHVHHTICNTKWYQTPLKIQKFVLFVMRKTTKTYKVDAGGLFSPSLESLATSMSLMLSCLTLLCSIQQ